MELVLLFGVILLVYFGVILILKRRFFRENQWGIVLYLSEVKRLIKENSTKSDFLYYFNPQKTVKWFNFASLIKTFERVANSSQTLAIIDKREVEASFGTNYQDVPYERQKNETFYFDFLADTGDGFDSTVSVFYPLTRDGFDYVDGNSKTTLSRADLLVIGGDLVYPDATERNYIDRFKGPIRFLFPRDGYPLSQQKKKFNKAHTLLVATPGNHDWYDGLNSFFRMMCQQKRIGNYQTVQERSYFAFKLTKNVHLFGLDNQLMGDVDIPQMDYFIRYVDVLGDKQNTRQYVILVVAEPYWYNYVVKDKGKRRQRMDSMEYVIKELKRKANAKKNNNPNFDLRFKLIITGDIHHYAHYALDKKKSSEEIEVEHLITSGGGGAFGHMTSFLKSEINIPNFSGKRKSVANYKLKEVFPEQKESAKKNFYNLLFIFYNSGFTLLFIGFAFLITYIYTHNDGFFLRTISMLSIPTILYVIASKVVPPELSSHEKWINNFLYMTLFLASFCLQVFIIDILHDFFKMLDAKLISLILEPLYDKSIFDLLNIDAEIVYSFFSLNELQLLKWIMLGVLQSFLFGLYLFSSYHFFKVHITEASSSKVNVNDKNYIKFKITSSEITAYVIAVEKTYPWRKKIKKGNIIEVQKQIVQSRDQPRKFLKTMFGRKYKDQHIRIIEKIKIKLD